MENNGGNKMGLESTKCRSITRAETERRIIEYCLRKKKKR